MLVGTWPCVLRITPHLFKDVLSQHTQSCAALPELWGSLKESFLSIQMCVLRTSHVFFMSSASCFRKGHCSELSPRTQEFGSLLFLTGASWAHVQPSHIPLAGGRKLNSAKCHQENRQVFGMDFVWTDGLPSSTSMAVLVS